MISFNSIVIEEFINSLIDNNSTVASLKSQVSVINSSGVKMSSVSSVTEVYNGTNGQRISINGKLQLAILGYVYSNNTGGQLYFYIPYCSGTTCFRIGGSSNQAILINEVVDASITASLSSFLITRNNYSLVGVVFYT